MGSLVQPPAVAEFDWVYTTGISRGKLLPATIRSDHWRPDLNEMASIKPGTIQVDTQGKNEFFGSE